MKKKKHTKTHPFSINPPLKWVMFGGAVFISITSLLYTNGLVEKVRARENRQIEIFANSLNFLTKKNENNNFNIVFDEIIAKNNSIPVILTDINGNPDFYKNLPKADRLEGAKKQAFLFEQMDKMKEINEPIPVELIDREGSKNYGTKFIYYKDSYLLTQLRIYPYIQLLVIALFGVITFFIFSSLGRAEKDRLWVGLAKETAHQLGTPLSSLMAWSEYFKGRYPDEKSSFSEFDKDIARLKVITDRFSSIGNEPQLAMQNITEVLEEILSYLQARLSSKVTISLSFFPSRDVVARINSSLFAWVIENLCKNAVDAMDGNGTITIHILKVNENKVAVDISDTGRGIKKKQIRKVFNPGYTTKRRGWGLGLTLVKRIIDQYHKGRIFVRHSEEGKGTTFRIYLNRN